MRKTFLLTLVVLLGFTAYLKNGFTDEGPDNFRRIPHIIIGDPDFEKMRDLSISSRDFILGRKVAYIDMGHRGTCTGFLVGPDLLMTCHHCIFDDFGIQIPLTSIEVYMDYYEEPSVDPTRGDVTAGVAALLRENEAMDYALLQLDTSIGNTYGWLQLDTTTNVDTSDSVKIIQHPDGRSKEISRENSGVRNVAGHTISYFADTEPGSSGSPVFLLDGTEVIAIHRAGSAAGTHNNGTLMSSIVPEIEDWLPDLPPTNIVFTPSLIGNQTFTVNAPITPLLLPVATGGIEPYTYTLTTYALTPQPPAGLQFDATTRYLSGTPTTIGITNLTYTAIDAAGQTASLTFSITVVSNGGGTDVYMYWADPIANKIQRSYLDGTNIQDIATGFGRPVGIALDIAGGKIYWTDRSRVKHGDPAGRNSIQRMNLDGTNVETLVNGGPSVKEAIALDLPGGKMYWADWKVFTGGNKIQRANLDGTNVEDLVTGVFVRGDETIGPRGIALDLLRGKMYWTDCGGGKIQRANLDGTNVEDIVLGLNCPNHIALDFKGAKMYWTDWHADVIQRANFDGSDIEDLVIDLADPAGIAVDSLNGKMYWTDRGTGKIQRANLDGTNIEDLITTGLEGPIGITLGIDQLQPPVHSLRFSPNEIADQTFTVGTSVSLNLPIATGGTAPYTYTLAPKPPAGLRFDPIDRWIGGTPTTVMTSTNFTYTAIDARSASVSLSFKITVIASGGNLDVNRDGRVDVLDLILVAVFYGTRGDGLPADVNADGIVNVQDFAAVAAGVDAANGLPLQGVEAALLILAQKMGDIEAAAEAPMGFGNPPQHVRSAGIAYSNVADALTNVRHFAVGDARLVKSVALLERLLSYLREMATIPETTALLPNYPNPFNPETWIPYHLSKDAEVIVAIYNIQGSVVRALRLGHQPAGVYENRGRAAYWDGRNAVGEPVASGVYFYTLTAGDFTATRKLLIAK